MTSMNPRSFTVEVCPSGVKWTIRQLWQSVHGIATFVRFSDSLAVFIGSAHSSPREFLVRAGAGFGAVALNALVVLEASAEKRLNALRIDPLNPYAARPPHFAPKAKSVIFLFMVGG